MHAELAAGPLSAKPGRILMYDGDRYHWTDPKSIKPWRGRFIFYSVLSFVIGFAIALVVLIAVAVAEDIPGGLTCRQARYIALSVGESTTWNRDRARAIAESYGLVMTEAQLDALEKCFDAPQHKKGMSK